MLLKQKFAFLAPLRCIGLHNLHRWRKMLITPPSKHQYPAVYYGFDSIIGKKCPTRGGRVKLQTLSEVYPNTPSDWNILYLVSSALPDDWWALLFIAKKRGAKVVLNQNGVAYPGWHGLGWQFTNMPLRACLKAADHVFYQSEFCLQTANRFLGVTANSYSILHNPVDSSKFVIKAQRPQNGQPWILLLGGTQYQAYRVRIALEVCGELLRRACDIRLIITGELCWRSNSSACHKDLETWIDANHMRDRVELTGKYTQEEMPKIFCLAHILLHTKYNDPCPTIVIEAMASGLPVVYSLSGGVPELVGNSAGVGVAVTESYTTDCEPNVCDMVDAVIKVIQGWENMSKSAIDQAKNFNPSEWIEKHRSKFEKILLN